jgi:AraC family transcriptional regulator of adaptative response/methylated-DNA-[protein]-cysteine methyltransferase
VEPLIEDTRWKSVAERSREADGRFVYAVRTTGIYCRPTCPSRRPLRQNVAFFDSYAEAEAKGFRPCRRCFPAASDSPVSSVERILRACKLIDASDGRPGLQVIATAAGLSPFHFHRLFRKVVGMTPREYGAATTEERFRRLLGAGAAVTSAIYDAGFGSSSRVYETAHQMLGMTPGAYRAGAPGLTIRYSISRCALGGLLVAATSRGVCAIELGDKREVLQEHLRVRFPGADFVADDEGLKRLVESVTRFIDAPDQNLLQLPLDIRGTAFQRLVWKSLRRVPVGATVTYGDLARRIGRPRAVRAVAQACASNTLALAIPCHRVIRGDGAAGGYRWGAKRKRVLLSREHAAATGTRAIGPLPRERRRAQSSAAK